MFRIRPQDRLCLSVLLSFLAIIGVIIPAKAAESSSRPAVAWDSSKYIRAAEVRRGMEAYCLTEFGPDGIERFALEVLDVVPDFDPGRTAILVKGTDERFVHAGAVAGCSGSPVYIDGRLAGALAYGWQFGKDALYGVTTIEDMLKVGRGGSSAHELQQAIDFRKPINLAEIAREAGRLHVSRPNGPMGAQTLPCPLVTSGLSAEGRDFLAETVQGLGMMVVPGAPSKMAANDVQGGSEAKTDRKLTPGACLAVPLVTGDIVIGTYGTVTEVDGDRVYGFGHPFLGYGLVDMPIATGTVHTVVSSMLRSFKLCSVDNVVGALRMDEGAGVVGYVGATAKTIPLTIHVDRYNDTQKRTYDCQLASNRMMTPSMVGSAVAGAALYKGELPPDHTVEYGIEVGVEGYDPIAFKNLSSGSGIGDVLVEGMATVRMLMNNPYREIDVTSLDFDMRITSETRLGQIWTAHVSDAQVEAGDRIDISVSVEAVRGGRSEYTIPLEIPKDVKPGQYELMICGSRDYEQYLMKHVPHRFIAYNIDELVSMLERALTIDRDRLYCVLSLAPGGVTIERAELPDLPTTKTLMLYSDKRAATIRPYPHWIEKTVKTDSVLTDRKVLRITVKK